MMMLVAIFLVATLALAAACGGGDDDTGGDDEATPTDDAGDGGDQETPTDGGDEETPEATDEGDGDGGDAAGSLADFAEEYQAFEGKVTYTLTGFGGDTDSPTSMSIYQLGSSSRVDYETSDGLTSFIDNPDGSFICSEGECLKYPAGSDSINPAAAFTSFLSADYIEESYGDLLGDIDLDESSETIAGIDATCFSYSGDIDDTTAGDESGQVCFSDDGLLLRLQFEGAEDSGGYEATEASGDVSDSDFEPPFPVTDLSDLYGTPSS